MAGLSSSAPTGGFLWPATGKVAAPCNGRPFLKAPAGWDPLNQMQKGATMDNPTCMDENLRMREPAMKGGEVEEKRVTIWNWREKRKLSGNAAPFRRNLAEYLRKHPVSRPMVLSSEVLQSGCLEDLRG